MSEGLFTEVQQLIEQGGWVMPFLVAMAFALWYALGFRFLTLRRGDRRTLREIIDARLAGERAAPRGIVDAAVAWGLAEGGGAPVPRATLDVLFGELDAELNRGAVLVRTVVMIAPLAGLLGTVGGMIETFRSLSEMALFTQGGGIAGGIAQALLTTQMGLAVAVPGIVVGRLLDRQEATLRMELEALKDILAVGVFNPRRVEEMSQ